jgi:hypothetical protein
MLWQNKLDKEILLLPQLLLLRLLQLQELQLWLRQLQRD